MNTLSDSYEDKSFYLNVLAVFSETFFLAVWGIFMIMQSAQSLQKLDD